MVRGIVVNMGFYAFIVDALGIAGLVQSSDIFLTFEFAYGIAWNLFRRSSSWPQCSGCDLLRSIWFGHCPNEGQIHIESLSWVRKRLFFSSVWICLDEFSLNKVASESYPLLLFLVLVRNAHQQNANDRDSLGSTSVPITTVSIRISFLGFRHEIS